MLKLSIPARGKTTQAISRQRRLRQPALADRTDGFHRQPLCAPDIRQHCRISAAPRAKGKVLARDDARRARPRDQPFGDEVAGGDAGQFAIEFQHEHCLRARFAEQTRALIEAGQAKRRRVRLEVTHRMRIERRDDRGDAARFRQSDRAAHNRLMPGVKPVEITQRNDAATQGPLDNIFPV